MSETKNLARVLLRSDGSVHIAFRDIRSIYATAENLLHLFRDPIEFINTISYTYKESTFEINRRRESLEDILGLTLATVSGDKQVVCVFPELFRFILDANNNDELKDQPLNMKSFEFESELSDEKSFLLRYYLEFTNHLTSIPAIKHNIKLREEVQFEIIREILNAFFSESLPEKPSVEDVSAKIQAVESSATFSSSSEQSSMVSISEYAKRWDISSQTVRKYAQTQRLKSAHKDSKGYYLIDINEEPLEWDLRKQRRQKPRGADKMHYRPRNGSAADVEEYIKKGNLFSSVVAPYIHTFDEMDYYVKKHYREVCWDGRHALIIDVNPDYVSSITGIRNRDLMLAGKAPVIPDRTKEEYVFHIHHVGQHSSSPFAIIPEYDHNGASLSAVFHQGAPDTELHGPMFEALKKNFWKTYLEKYDEVGRFEKIEYLNRYKDRKKTS